MASIRKIPLVTVEHQTIGIPEPSEIIHVGLDQFEHLCMWVKCPDGLCTPRTIVMCKDDEDVPDDIRHLGSAIVRYEMWHIFDSGICSVDSKLRELSREVENLDDRICQIRNPDRDY